MLTLQKADGRADIAVDTNNVAIEHLLEKEWLLSNTRGGYASSTVVGCNTRRYHGLLVGSLSPPVRRVVALSNCLETVILGPGKFNLGTCEFPGAISPDGYLRLKGFSKDVGVHFYYQLGDLRLTKSVYLFRERDSVALVYEFAEVGQPLEFEIRPFVALRDFHSLRKSDPGIIFTADSDELLIRNEPGDCGRLLLNYPGGFFEEGAQWWFNFVYRCDRERGQDFTEDLFSPGVLRYRIDSPARLVLWADLSGDDGQGKLTAADRFLAPDIEYVVQELSEHTSILCSPVKVDDTLVTLYKASDQFVARREKQDPEGNANEGHATILAGFPWFADWGRDTFISLPGLLLATGRLEEAKSVLLTFAEAARDGMIPNCFDDYGDTPHFNSVDASLWFINSAFRWLAVSGDNQTFKNQLLPVIISVIDFYQKGTMFGIHADKDGLITAGDSNTQLTWMDAKYGGVAFTPRHGKAVEVNALWYNAMMLLVQYLSDYESGYGQLLGTLRARVSIIRESFCKVFWNESWGWLNDCITPEGTADATLRPNQIFAVSMPFSALEPARQKAVVEIVEKKLVTPFGLRTLSPDDRRYHGEYSGPQQQRDEAYHQGTVWPYLLGPFVEAYLKVQGFKRESKRQALQFIKPLLRRISEDGCLGQVSEIFDGDPPHRPKGCFAQAWSVAELLRAYLLVRD